MALLSWADLSYVMPVTAISYVVTAFAARLFLGENISPARWAGILLVTAGVMTLVRTNGGSYVESRNYLKANRDEVGVGFDGDLRYHGRRCVSIARNAAARRDSRFPPRRDRQRIRDGGAQLLRDHFDLRHGGFVLLIHEAGIDRAHDLCGADVGGGVHPRDFPRPGTFERGSGLAALGRSRSDPGRRGFHFAVSWFAAAAAVLVGCGAIYNLLAIAGALKFRRKNTLGDYGPPVSILKPVRGRDAHFYEAIRSHAVQRYPQFELIFGTADTNDPALEDIERLHREFPQLPIRIVFTENDAPNGKVGSLEILAARRGMTCCWSTTATFWWDPIIWRA